MSPTTWTAVTAFYEQRGGAPAWEDSDDATHAFDLIRTAAQHGLKAGDYDDREIAALLDERARLEKSDVDEAARTRQTAEADVRVTTALLVLGRDVAVGRTSPSAISSSWKARRPVPDLAGTLSRAADAGDIGSWIDAIRPRHPEYVALQKALASLREQQEAGGWPTVPAAAVKPGASHPSVSALRARLVASGELPPAAVKPESRTYDSDLDAAVKAFQDHHALKATGIIDHATLAAMNVPLEDRIRQVEVNLERWRWVPDDLGARHFLVNIPHFHLVAREQGRPVMDIRVVVGKRGNETPVFSSAMQSVVFSPYWNIPDTIVEGETAPAVVKDPGYLARNNIEILRTSSAGAKPLDPSTVDWDDVSELRDLAFRQRPGASNALGHVKFLFPNSHNVYLHDTPADELFARAGRAFSHGCVRVEEPEALAAYVLRGHPEWNQGSIRVAMHAGVERHVKLREPIPVHLVYFTAWVDEHGGLHFQPDIYGYDDKQRH